MASKVGWQNQIVTMKKSSRLTMLTKNISKSEHKYITFIYILSLFLSIMASPVCNILTWNVRGIMSSAGSLGKLLDDKNIDIAFISEHKLREQQSSFLSSIHSNFSSFTVCDTSAGPNIRCGKGGVAILYKKSCQFTISKLDIQINDRIMGIQIDSKHLKPLYAFSV